MIKAYEFKIWHIKNAALLKFLLMSCMMFIILLCHNATRLLKDSVIMNTFGAEAISFIKLWLEVPFGSAFILIYYKLCNTVTTEQAFRIIVLCFLSFYGAFAFIFYPYRHYFHFSEGTISHMILLYPNFKWFIIIFGKWSITTFYLLAEFWPVITFTLLFWQLANRITSYEESKFFYPFFSFLGQASLLVSGAIVCYLINNNALFCKLFSNTGSITELTIKSIISFVLLLGCGILVLHYIIEKFVLEKHTAFEKKQNRLKMNILDSLKMTIKNPLLIQIALLITSYHICVNTIEGIWFTKVRELYATTDSFINYQSKVLFYTGICGMVAAMLGGFLIRKYSWLTVSIITPIVILLSGSIFFILVLSQTLIDNFIIKLGLTSLHVITFFGGFQNILGKGIKYGLFDVVKERLYINLDNEVKTKGKAAVDVIGTKFGKATGSIIQFSIFTLFPQTTITNIATFLMFLYIIAALLWIITTKKLANHVV